MDTTETLYISFDPDVLWQGMTEAYREAGGGVLYPGDEKEMLLRAVQAILVNAYAAMDNALRMDTLRYAVGEYLDIYGEKRDCARIEARAAEAVAEIEFEAGGTPGTIPEGTALTADGTRLYALTAPVTRTGYAQTVRATIRCTQTGSAGNGLEAGTPMQFMESQDHVIRVECAVSAVGGQEREDDDSYRERIRTTNITDLTAGPAVQYESIAEGVTSVIVDAKALNGGAGVVNVYLILSDETGSAAILQSVADALNGRTVRPLTDTVHVYQATKKQYTLKLQYRPQDGSDIAAAVAAAAADYQAWQDGEIGRAFNPDRLMSAVYQAGALRVQWGTGSAFDDGDVEYTEIQPNERCLGTITITQIPEA